MNKKLGEVWWSIPPKEKNVSEDEDAFINMRSEFV